MILFELDLGHGTGVEVRFDHLGVKKAESADADEWQRSLGNLRAEPAERRPALGIGKKLFQQTRRVNQPAARPSALWQLRRVNRPTVINFTWLLTDDVTQPPIDGGEAAYTKATFEKFRAQSGFKQDSRGGALAVHFCFLANLVRLKALLLRALTDDQMPLCAYKLKQAFDEWETEFGVTLEDHKTVGSPFCGPAAQHLALEKMIEAGLDHGLTGDTQFELAIEIQTRKKARRPQQRPDRYEVFSDGRIAPLLGEKGVKSPLDPKKK